MESKPQQIGDYRIVGELGRGGMGTVYKGYDESLDREVAIKVLLESMNSDRRFVVRFKREAQSAAKLNHPNIIQVYNTGSDRGRPYFVMEFIEGKELNKLMTERGKMPLEEVIEITVQVCRGLEYAVRRKVIHRDIKPSNIMIDKEGTVKITDFGLAKLVDDTRLTLTGDSMGTPLYMSPEQTRGEKVGHRSDIYSLGATLYHMLVGSPPFEADTPIALAMKHANESLPPLVKFIPGISKDICDIVQKMMAKRIEKRYSSYEEVIEDLERERAAIRRKEAEGVDLPQGMTEESIYRELVEGLEKSKNDNKISNLDYPPDSE